MPYFALFYDTVDQFAERRLPYRQVHLGMVDAAHQSGALVLAGALRPDAGALLVFRADDREVAEAFARADPYVVNGLVKKWRVLEWAVVIGEHAVPR